MKLRVAIIIVFAFMLALLPSIAGCNGSPEPEPMPPPLTQPEPPEPLPIQVAVIPEGKWELDGHTCQTVVDEFRLLLPKGLLDHLQKPPAEKTDADYDVNMCFTVLEHLFMEPGYILDYVYQHDGFAGLPIIYARRIENPPILTFEQYAEARSSDKGIADIVNFNQLKNYNNAESNTPNRIRVDGTPEGFFEYSVLRIMAAQFYLHWHASGDDNMIICEPAEVGRIVQSLYPIPPDFEDFEQEARNLDIQPYVEVNGDEVTVSLVMFSKWGGFTRIDSVINRAYPHKILRIEQETLLEYDCGIVF